MTTRINSIARCAGAVAAVLVLAGCQPGASGSEPASTGASGSQDLVAAGREYAQCVRDHGVPNYPDMIVVGGYLTLPDDATGDAAEEALRANPQAAQACRHILERLPAAAPKNREPSAEDRQNLLKFAQCMRDNGIPEWPDPRADGSFPIAGTPLESEVKSARMQAATQACRQYWDREISVK